MTTSAPPTTSVILDQFGRPYAASLENPAMSLDDPRTWDDVLGGNLTETGVQVTPRKAIGYPPIWKGINLLSTGVAKLPLVVYERDGEDGRTRAKKHAAYSLLRRRPNRFISAFHFKRTLTYHALLWGNGYAAIFRDRNGQPEELLILPPTTAPVQKDGDLWYIANIGGEDTRIPARDVLHLRGLSFDGLVGYSVIDIMGEALGVGLATRSYAARFFGEGATSGGVLMVPQSFGEEKVKNLLKAWEQMSEGLKRAHKVALLQEGAKFERTTINAQESQMVETQEHEIRMAANILNIPPHKLGDNSKSSYNSLEQENRAYLQDSLDPWLVCWESECDAKLLSDQEQADESHFCEFIRAALERTDTRNEIAALVEQVNNGILSLDEARAKQNLPPIPGGLGKKFRSPVNIAELGTTPAAPPKPADPSQPRAALQALARDRFDRLIDIESNKATCSAKATTATGDAWLAWIDRFYAQHRKWMREALAPVVRMACALDGRNDPGDLVDQLVAAHIADSTSQLKAISPADVPALVAQWPARVDAFINSLTV